MFNRSPRIIRRIFIVAKTYLDYIASEFFLKSLFKNLKYLYFWVHSIDNIFRCHQFKKEEIESSNLFTVLYNLYKQGNSLLFPCNQSIQVFDARL